MSGKSIAQLEAELDYFIGMYTTGLLAIAEIKLRAAKQKGITMNSEVFNTIIDAARKKVETLPEIAEWQKTYEALSKKLGDDGELFDVVWCGLYRHSNAMFRLGWELRGNPDKLFELPDPE